MLSTCVILPRTLEVAPQPGLPAMVAQAGTDEDEDHAPTEAVEVAQLMAPGICAKPLAADGADLDHQRNLFNQILLGDVFMVRLRCMPLGLFSACFDQGGSARVMVGSLWTLSLWMKRS